MRQFFATIISDLHIYSGNRAQMRDWPDEDIQKLLDALERTSARYSYIPKEKQKEIIQNQVETDKEYQNINVRTVTKWLELNGKQYFKEEAHQETEQTEYVTGERRQEWLDKFAKAVLNATQEFTSPGQDGHKGSGTRLRENIEKSGGIRKFVIDGMEIYAVSEQEAIEQRKHIV